MPDQRRNEAVERLAEGHLAATGTAPEPEVLDRLAIYLAELERWNRSINLVARDSVERWIDLHFTDSLFLANLARKAGNLADIGSGAGFPGLCLKCALPQLETTLFEPRAKRAAFLRQVARKAGLSGLTVAETRVEPTAGTPATTFRHEPPKKHGNAPASPEKNTAGTLATTFKYKIVVSRGVAAAADFLALAAVLCVPGGIAATLKGEKTEEELAAFRASGAARDFRLADTVPYVLPLTRKKRNILIFEKKS